MPFEDVYKVSLFTSQDQKQFVNTHYYEIGTVVVVDDFEEAQALADTFVTFFQAAYQGVLSDDVQFGCIKVQKVKGPKIPLFIQYFSDIQGSQVGPPLPDNLTMVIRRRHDVGDLALRSLLHISGVRVADTDDSFLDAAFVSGNLATLVNLYNDQMVASASFNLAEFNPVIPHTPRKYFTDISMVVDNQLNELTRNDGLFWDVEGFVSGGQFRINKPSKSKGTYTATVAAASTKISLSDNQLETDATEVMSGSQATGPVDWFALGSAVPQVSIRQLKRRRSSHTAIVA